MTEPQQKKFDKWLEPYILGSGHDFVFGWFIETREGTLYIGSEEHDKWVTEKQTAFFKKEPPLAGMVYVPWNIHEYTPEENEELEREREKACQEWNVKHECCPRCKNDKTVQSLINVVWHSGTPYEDNVNNAVCPKCGWYGNVNKLKPREDGKT
jgi:rubredoxin